MPFPSPVPVPTQQFLLPGIHRHHRLARCLELPHPLADVPEPGIPIRVLPPLQRLAIRLQAVTQRMQQAVHAPFTHPMTLGAQDLRQPCRTQAGPAQRTPRSAPRDRIQQPLQGPLQFRVPLLEGLAPTTAPPPPFRCWPDRRHHPDLDFPQPRPDRVPRQPGRGRHPRDPSPAHTLRVRSSSTGTSASNRTLMLSSKALIPRSLPNFTPKDEVILARALSSAGLGCHCRFDGSSHTVESIIGRDCAVRVRSLAKIRSWFTNSCLPEITLNH